MTPAFAADTDGELAAEEDPKPLHTSPTALRTDGEVAVARAPVLLFGATELAKTAWPPLLVTPAVAPRTRASNCEEALPEEAPPLGALELPPLLPEEAPPLGALELPPLLPLVRPERAAPEVEPLDTELLPEDEDEAAPLPEEAPEVDEPGGALVAGPGTPGATALAPPAAGAEPGGGVEDGAVPDAGIPVSGAVQAHARLAPAIAVASTANTANEKSRVLRTRNRLFRSEQSYSWFAPNSR